jgi:hypothetical protein
MLVSKLVVKLHVSNLLPKLLVRVLQLLVELRSHIVTDQELLPFVKFVDTKNLLNFLFVNFHSNV